MQNFDSDMLGKLPLWSPRGKWKCESKMDLRTIVRETSWIENSQTILIVVFWAIILCEMGGY